MASKRPRASTLSAIEEERIQVSIMHEAARTTRQSMYLNPNDDLEDLEEVGGLEDPEEPVPEEPEPQWPTLLEVDLESDQALLNYARQVPSSQYIMNVSEPPPVPLSPLSSLTSSDTSMTTGVTERTYENKYALPELGEVPGEKPDFQCIDCRLIPVHDMDKLAPESAGGWRYVLQQIISGWPCAPACTPREIKDAAYKIVTPAVFYNELFRPALKELLNRQHNQVEKEARFNITKLVRMSRGEKPTSGKAKGYEMDILWNKLESDDGDLLKVQLLRTFLDIVCTKKAQTRLYHSVTKIPPALKEAATFAKKEAEVIHLWRVLGQRAYESALWVGCRRVSDKESLYLKGKFIVESDELRRLGLDNGGFDEDELVFADDPTWTRIIKPKSDDEMVTIIFYVLPDTDSENSNQADGSPGRPKVEEKDIFGAVVYNAERFTAGASEVSQASVHLEAQAILKYTQNREKIKRRFKYPGTMDKSGLGVQATNGILHTPQLPIDKLKPGPKPPTAYMKQKIAQQTSLRVAIERNRELIQARNFALLEGLLPHIARKQLEVARKAHLINRFGFPNTAAFASFAYGAPGHKDHDDAASMGWVSSRSNQILDDESNFFWSDFKVIMQLAENTHWIWDAASDTHGTTLGRLCAKKPKSWKTYSKNHPLKGQWSRANTITHTIVTSSTRMHQVDSA